MSDNSGSPFAWIVGFLVIAVIGFADAVYLTASHYLSGVPTCTIVEGCDEVALSEYSTLGPVPVALLGTLFYFVMMIWSFVWFDLRKAGLFRFMPFITVPAFMFSMGLVYLMLFVIEALCIYCLVSAGTTTLLMLISFKLRKIV